MIKDNKNRTDYICNTNWKMKVYNYYKTFSPILEKEQLKTEITDQDICDKLTKLALLFQADWAIFLNGLNINDFKTRFQQEEESAQIKYDRENRVIRFPKIKTDSTKLSILINPCVDNEIRTKIQIRLSSYLTPEQTSNGMIKNIYNKYSKLTDFLYSKVEEFYSSKSDTKNLEDCVDVDMCIIGSKRYSDWVYYSIKRDKTEMDKVITNSKFIQKGKEILKSLAANDEFKWYSRIRTETDEKTEVSTVYGIQRSEKTDSKGRKKYHYKVIGVADDIPRCINSDFMRDLIIKYDNNDSYFK